MPRDFIPWSEFLPDEGELRNPGLLVCKQVIPYGDKFLLDSTLDFQSSVIAGVPTGMHVHPSNGDAGWMIYYGTGNGASTGKLWEIDPSDTPLWLDTDITGTTGPYTVDVPTGFQFTSFGPHEIAVSGHDEKAQIRLDGSGDFVDMITSADEPRARFVSTIGNRVVLANIKNLGTAGGSGIPDPNPNLVWVSATDNARVFGNPTSHPADLTDFQFLNDNLGEITAVTGGTEYGFLFKRRGIYAMSYRESFSFGLEFNPISLNKGTRFHNSLVWVGGVLYFWGPNGPSRIALNGEIEELGLGKISRSITDDRWVDLDPDMAIDIPGDDDVWRISACYDPGTDTVRWMYPTDLSSNPRVSHEIVYSIRGERFSILERDTTITTNDPPATNGLTRMHFLLTGPETGLKFSSMRDAMIVASEPAFLPSDRPRIWRFRSGGGFVYNTNPVLGTGFVALHEEARVSIDGVRPVFTRKSGASQRPEFTVKIRGKDRPDDAASEKSYTSTGSGAVDGLGFIRTPGSGTFSLVAINVEIAASGVTVHPSTYMAEMEGIEVEWSAKSKSSPRRS